MEVGQHLSSTRGVDREYAALSASLNDGDSHPSASTVRSSESTNRGKLSSTASHRGSHESKPRLSKDQHERLEREFRNNRKPTTANKKQFSQQLGISLEKVNNWFQNRRAKVKHEEKKHRHNAFPPGSQPGIALPENGFFDPFHNPSHAFPPASYPFMSQPGLPVDGQYIDVASPNDCPTIHEEPLHDDGSRALMTFMGLNPQDGRHAQLQDVDDISKQFNPRLGPNDAYGPRMLIGSGFPPASRVQDVPNVNGSLNVSHGPHIFGGDPKSTVASHMDIHRATSIAGGAALNSSMYDQHWMASQAPNHVLQQNQIQFGLDDAREMVSQLQAQTSQLGSSSTEHQAFSHPTAQTSLAVPQPLLPAQPPFFDGARPSTESPSFTGQTEPERLSTPDETKYTLSRTDSGTSILAESMGGVALDSSQSHVARAASRTPSLSFAQRRQKRPANISAVGPRSYSCAHAPLSASDRNHPAQPSADPHLRRIKSSTGVLNGRIQKASGQRSPLYQSHFANGDGNPHLSRQLSTHSLNTALQGEDHYTLSNVSPPPPMPPPSTIRHGQHPSSGSGMTHITLPEDATHTPASVWSGMPNTADTAATSVYYSVPQTAATSKSYMSPPHTPMDSSGVISASFRSSHIQPIPPPQEFTQSQPQSAVHSEAISDRHPVISAGIPLAPVHPGPHYSTDDLVMNSVPTGQPLPTYAPMASDSLRSNFSNSIPQIPASGSFAGLHTDHTPPQPIMMIPSHEHQTQQLTLSDANQQAQHQRFLWSLQGGSQNAEQQQNQDLQIHQFTPSNPVDPAHLPPKHKQSSPRQTYSFQNFGPEYYCSPKSQSSQSKASSPGHLQIGV